MIIAVDFDGTCVTHEYPRVGRDVGAVPVLRELVAAGHQLILWTMRSGGRDDGTDPLQDAVEWFACNGIPLYGVNGNPTQKGWTQSPKAYAQDAALGAPLCDGDEGERPFIDWSAVRSLLLPESNLSETIIYCQCGATIGPDGLCPNCGDHGFEPDGIAGAMASAGGRA